jgi:threonine aldolase
MNHEKSLGSDNHSGIHPKVLEAILAANEGATHAYGEDPYTERAIRKLKDAFGRTAEVSFTFNGTAANVLALKALTKSHHAILCTAEAHINTDECGAPEAFLGCKLLTLPHVDGKLTEQSLEVAESLVATGKATFPHRTQPKVISVAQSTELGTVYTTKELSRIAEFARKHNLYFHVDGARLANAAAALGVSLKAMTAEVGVDVVSFGGTKNGILAGEAILFFRPELAADFELIRKQGMQLASKMRFFAVQFEALLTDDLWLKNARQANRMAQLLAKEAKKIRGVKIQRPVEANAVFAILPKERISELQKKFYFYVWNREISEVRWMTSFNTTEKDIREFLDLLQSETKSGHEKKST